MPDGKYGDRNSKGEWNGLIGELTNQRADMIAADLTVTSQRSEAVSFTTPYFTVGMGMLFKKRSPEVDLFAFLSPFSTLVWLIILGSLVLIALSLFLFSKTYKSDDDPLGNITACFYFGLACLLAQGPETYPRTLFSRMTAISWWFFCLMIITLYTANLTSMLTIFRAQLPMKSFEELLYHKQLTYGIVDFPILEDLFEQSQFAPFQVMWDHMLQNRDTSFYGPEEGVKKVRESENFVFIRESPYLQYAVTKPPCDLDFIIDHRDA